MTRVLAERARHHGRREWLLVCGLALGLVAIPLSLSIGTGSIMIPHNDAWSHAKIAITWATTGRWELVQWNRSALVGQIVILGPLAGSIVAQHLFVAACAVVSLVASYGIVSPRAGRPVALLTVLALAANADFAILSTSYMADLPAWQGRS